MGRVGDTRTIMRKPSYIALILALAGCTPVGSPRNKSEPKADAAAAQESTTSSQTGASDPKDAGGAANSSSTPIKQEHAGLPPDAGARTPTSAAGSRAAPVSHPSEMERENQAQAAPDASMAAANGGREASAGAGGNHVESTANSAMDDDTPVRPADSECEYIELRGRSDGAGAPLQVEADAADQGTCVLLDMGFEEPTQALGFSPLVDHPELVSYIMLRILDRSDLMGPIVSCTNPFPTHKLVAAWAKGGSDWYFPKDVGIDLGRGLFLLEVHYLNSGKPAVTDRSGMRVCTTKKPRPKAASISWLGNQVFSIPAGAQDYPISGRCTPTNQTEPIRLLRVMPFMNTRGKRATMQIDRIDGTVQPVLDVMTSPDTRPIYDTPFSVRAGDSVLSTCYFDNASGGSVSVGVNQNNELCHFFVLAYPAYQLVGSNFNIENNSCLGSP